MAVESAASAIARLVGGPETTGRDLALGGPYEGADRFDRALALWAPPLMSADAEMLGEKGQIDARVRDLQRNDGYIHAGSMLHRDGIVGSMYLLNSQPDYDYLKLDEVWAGEYQMEVEAKFMLAATSANNWFDAAGTNDLTALVRLAVGVYTSGGEVLASAEWLRDPTRPFRTAIQMIDTDRLSTPWEKQWANPLSGERVRGGIRQNRFGKPLGYYIRNGHQSDFDRFRDSMNWTYVPARKPWGRAQVLHIKEQMRVDQSRAVAEMVSGIKATRIAHKYRDITLQQAVISAMYAASIESDLPPDAVFAQMGGGNNESAGEIVAGYATDYLAAINKYTSSSRNMQIDGVKIPHFFPGTRLSVKQVGAPGGVGQEFEQSVLRYVSAILGVSYEELSRDYSKTNYSSARAAMAVQGRFMNSRKKIVADGLANFIFQLWLEEQFNSNAIESLPRNAPNFYEALNKEAYSLASWIGAARGQIDELKETQASVLKIKYGLSTHEEELSKQGKDWRKVYTQLSREKKRRKDLDIELVEDNMQNAITGAPRDKTPGGGGGKTKEAKAEDSDGTLDAVDLEDDDDAAPIQLNMDMTGMAEVIAASNAGLVDAVKTMAERPQQPINVTLSPALDIDVKVTDGKRITTVKKYDEKGRILVTENSPAPEEENPNG